MPGNPEPIASFAQRSVRTVSRPVDAPAASVMSRVQNVLTDYLDDRADALRTVGPDLDPVLAAARSLILSGGKRLRPSFAYWGWRSVRAESDDDSALITAAAALELLHGCALVHDDVMDASATRRGRASAHAEFAALHRAHGWTGDPERFGSAAAILLGDLLLSWADALFAGAAIEPAHRAATRAAWDEMRQLVMAGQYLDVLVQARGDFSADDALRVAMFKTSKYTVEGPLHFGAAAAGAPPETFAALSGYGLAVGEAFQLRDDVLGVFGDPEITGKPAGDDLREGKRTLLVALAMRAASTGQAALLREHLGEETVSPSLLATLREVITDTGALAEVERRISERTAVARDALASDAITEPARAALDALAVAATQRHT
jgi:geranylgeranyl diphosphate synthase type I